MTTASTFETAELYRTLAKDLMSSERPKALKGDELEAVQPAARRAGVPFEEQAIQIHELNTARVKEGVYDDGVRASFKALAELKPGRYGKTEVVQDVVVTPNCASCVDDVAGVRLRVTAARWRRARYGVRVSRAGVRRWRRCVGRCARCGLSALALGAAGGVRKCTFEA